MKHGKFFYGWYIVIGGFLIMATCYTIFVNCMSLFLVPITTDLGITRAQFNLCTSISAVVGIFASLVVGKLLDKGNARLIGSISVGIVGLDLIGWAFVTQLWQMYALSFITGFCVLAGTRLLVSVLITNWFDKKRGLAVSLALMGSGFGGVVLSPVTSHLITSIGWHHTFLILAAVTLVASLPLAALTFHNNPASKGLKPYGADEASQEDGKPGALSETLDLGWKKVRSSGAFIVLVIGFVFMGMANGGVIINISATMTDAGYTAEFAAKILSFYMFVVIIGKITLGAVYDKYGLIAGTLLGSITTILGVVSLIFAPYSFGPYAFALTFGFGTCLGTVAPPLMAVNEFGKKDIGTIVGVITAFEMIGAAFAAPVTGAVADHYGSYTLAWIGLAVASVLMLITLVMSVRMSSKLIDSQSAA